MLPKIRNLVAAGAIAIAASPVFAGGGGSVMGNGGATEITQLLNHVELASQTISSELQSLTQLKQLYYQTLENIPLGKEFASAVADVTKTYQAVSGTLSATQRLYGNVANFQQILTHRQAQFGASGLDWANYVAREIAIAQNRKEQVTWLTAGELQTAQAVEDAYRDVQQYQRKMYESVGSHDAMMVMNGQVNTLISLTAASANAAKNHYQAANFAMQEDIGARERATKAADEQRAAQERVNARAKQILGGAK